MACPIRRPRPKGDQTTIRKQLRDDTYEVPANASEERVRSIYGFLRSENTHLFFPPVLEDMAMVSEDPLDDEWTLSTAEHISGILALAQENSHGSEE